VTQIRVHKQPRARRRAQEESADAGRRQADRRTGIERGRDQREPKAKIYDWLALPSWSE
jgi:hypothetical protein